ncbi:YybS family protein [Marinimicrobium alkaliphilum]|uniref:hypothetical protein n=1 Tax=Marinimicrobium alkaliphilum TaxID=2202654 RepID=UPI0013005A29|nr:hypothetical protein [Marinimicrobium alkaliphilum]
MRALANFIMRSRTRAAVVALLGNWVPLIGPATISLVGLRMGLREGLLIAVWGLLPALLTLLFSDFSPVMPLMTVAAVVTALIAAQILRVSASWPHALMSLVALSVLAALTVSQLAPEALASIAVVLQELLDSLQDEAAEGLAVGQSTVLGLIAYGVAFSTLLGLLLGRWWQALLYNPGGFRQEFHGLRLQAPQAIVSLGAGVFALFQGPEYGVWATVFTLPLTLAGLALFHGLAARRKLGTPWLVVFYLLLVFVPPAGQLLIAVAFVDTWLNFRGRVKPKQ